MNVHGAGQTGSLGDGDLGTEWMSGLSALVIGLFLDPAIIKNSWYPSDLLMSAFSLLVSVSGTVATTSVLRMVLRVARGGLMEGGIGVISSDPVQ